MVTTDYGHAISALRQAQKMSRKELAERTGLSYKLISYIENGRASTYRGLHLAPIAEALGVTEERIKELAHIAQTSPEGVAEVNLKLHIDIPNLVQRRENALKLPTIPSVINRLRKVYSLSLEDLSRQTQIPIERLSAFESGTEDIRQGERIRLAQVFDVPAELLNPRNPYRIRPRDLYERIRASAINLNLTPQKLAEKTGYPLEFIFDLEISSDIPDKEVVERFASALKINPRMLGDSKLNVRRVAAAVPKPLVYAEDQTFEAWGVPIQRNPSTELRKKILDAKAAKSKQLPEPTKKDTLKTEIVNKLETLLSLPDYSEKDKQELHETIDILFQATREEK